MAPSIGCDISNEGKSPSRFSPSDADSRDSYSGRISNELEQESAEESNLIYQECPVLVL